MSKWLIALIVVGYLFFGVLTLFIFMLYKRIESGSVHYPDLDYVIWVVFAWPLCMVFGFLVLLENILTDKLPDLVDLLGDAIDEWKDRRDE